jgi:ATP-dependent DNA helicase PIF1
MTYVCFHCRALKFEKETSGMCCSNGKINLPPLAEPPDPLLTYLAGETRESKLFLQHIRKYNSCFQMTSFGATKIVTYDNFMQTFKVQGQVYHLIGSLLPVPEENPQFLFNACLKNSALWRHVKKIQLSTNMRGQTFANQLLDMGDGNLPINRETNEISFPMNFCQLQPSIIDLENSVFPNIANNYQNHDWLRERAILAPKNDDVSKINNRVQMKIPGQATIYKSIDTVTEEDQAVNYRTEFLNSLEPAGMPPHILTLKIGSPILLLRNLNTPQLCNGTRLSVKKMTPNVIEATIINNKYKGEDVLIPRIPMIPDDLPFTFKRLQFPVRLAFAMTINKAQGQSLQVAGLNLENPCFSHGQLYVACSRVGTPRSLYVYTPNQKTKNIVHPLALR